MRDFGRRMHEQARRQASVMRDRARAAAARRKEQYLGARVSRELRDKVTAWAESLGIPVSILIRDILEEAFRDGGAKGTGKGARASKTGTAVRFPGVIGWEDIVLNRAMQCAACSRALDAGSHVKLGVSAPGEDYVVLCDQCSESG
jgi:hypothetical protein